MSFTVEWAGATGQSYKYWNLGDLTANAIQAVAGNYVFAKQLPNGNFAPLYFGIALDLRDRITNHEVWPEARRLGVTHVMAHTTPAGEQARLAEERDLIQFWNPPLNVQHRTTG